MSSPVASHHTLADFSPLLSQSSPPACSTPSIALSPGSNSLPVVNMKDVSASRYSRPTAYPKKRPSPHGVTKSHKTPLLPPARRAPMSAKTAMMQQRQRDMQVLALRKQGVLLEEEYRSEIQFYMHDMEVRDPFFYSCSRWFLTYQLVVALHAVIHPVYGSTTRDQVAHASLSCRLSRRDSLHIPPPS